MIDSVTTAEALTPIQGASTIDDREVAQFTRLAERWWDETGPFAPLHRINKTRLAYLRARLVERLGVDDAQVRPFGDFSLLDLGCGGGLVAEPMARLGFSVTGVDAGEKNVAAARLHAEGQGLRIDYRHASAEDLAMEAGRFDVVLALEIIEHVADPALFVQCAASLVKPGGVLILSTINRSVRGLALGVVAAEYVLGWLPRGTHDWRKFVKPSEAAAMSRAAGLTVERFDGLSFDLLQGAWRVTKDLGVNYFLVASKPR